MVQRSTRLTARQRDQVVGDVKFVKGRMVRESYTGFVYIQEIPIKWHREFKKLASKRDTTMVAMLVTFMEDLVLGNCDFPKFYERKRRRKGKKIGLYVRQIPNELKNQFKAKCAERGVSMNECLIRYMRTSIQHEIGSARP